VRDIVATERPWKLAIVETIVVRAGLPAYTCF